MRIGLVADTFSVEIGTGIARYSHELRRGLIDHGLWVETICPAPPKVPFGLAINHAVKMPYLVRRQAGRFDLIHSTSPITALAFPMVSKPKVVTYHDLVSLLSRNASTALHTRLAAPFFLRIGKFADRIIANSSQTQQELVTDLGIPAEKITVIPWGVHSMFRARLRPRQDGPVVGYVGALNRRKGLAYLMRAMAILLEGHPGLSAKLVICGQRSLEYRRLVDLAARLRLNRVIEFRGSVTDSELVNAYNSFDVFVLPSQWEGFGLPVLEAQRCGVPVIIREDAHIPAEVSTCCLRASSEQDMGDKIYQLLADQSLRRTVIERGLEYSRHFTWERTVEQTLKVYEQAAF